MSIHFNAFRQDFEICWSEDGALLTKAALCLSTPKHSGKSGPAEVHTSSCLISLSDRDFEHNSLISMQYLVTITKNSLLADLTSMHTNVCVYIH